MKAIDNILKLKPSGIGSSTLARGSFHRTVRGVFGMT
jgi:hypothetical protein